jgi:hypothetical protein
MRNRAPADRRTVIAGVRAVVAAVRREAGEAPANFFEAVIQSQETATASTVAVVFARGFGARPARN